MAHILRSLLGLISPQQARQAHPGYERDYNKAYNLYITGHIVNSDGNIVKHGQKWVRKIR